MKPTTDREIKGVKMVTQPKGSSICGQCCVAMVTNRPIEEVIKVVGHKHSTRTRELHAALKIFKVVSDKKLTRNSSNVFFSKTAILKITYDWRKNNGHWVVYKNGVVYCPSGEINHWTEYLKTPSMGRITSFLKIILP
jgi:hypothetical protein